MPTYDYKCDKCGHVFEKFQGITEKPLSRCPECKGKVRRLISPGAGIIFKGKGFYQTDYKSTSKGGSTSCGQKQKDTSSGCGKTDACSCCE